ncbi:hypothetical protein [Gordonia sp. CPCC 205333]
MRADQDRADRSARRWLSVPAVEKVEELRKRRIFDDHSVAVAGDQY